MIRMILCGIGAIVGGVILTIDSFEKPKPGMPTLPAWHGPALVIVGLGTCCYFGWMIFADSKRAKNPELESYIDQRTRQQSGEAANDVDSSE